MFFVPETEGHFVFPKWKSFPAPIMKPPSRKLFMHRRKTRVRLRADVQGGTRRTSGSKNPLHAGPPQSEVLLELLRATDGFWWVLMGSSPGNIEEGLCVWGGGVNDVCRKRNSELTLLKIKVWSAVRQVIMGPSNLSHGLWWTTCTHPPLVGPPEDRTRGQ